MESRMYRITVGGCLDSAATESFAGFEVQTDDHVTQIRGLMDQSALYGVLRRIELIGLELIEVLRQE
ncbi:MAG: hypothetical protein JWO63_332 [Frankiales bacterium]|jgi:hypothetical protein|nr:hypothetical protein [Frankiales bacterium]